ncbi:MAG: winged helix DNA-binding protein [Nitrosopumilus sp.]|uniref:winged helix DNA-binding protein n=1 Tax=Nitrosopumilus sp. TaxID=2024843 RepID=UPI00247CFB9B|nr:winged helix DNA-binding protein [Nitrosopumilus sp.]MCV0393309.1 winged helix DNA-binding protein [Nitrosopumilus sp.]
MLVEIPDPEVILGVILAFLVGLGGLYFYFKIRPFIKTKTELTDVSQAERLEYYERQLIDMKIRLDALEIQGIEQKPEDQNVELKEFLEKLTQKNNEEKTVEKVPTVQPTVEKEISTPKTPSSDYTNPVDFVLHQITTKPMTSRDIQITLKKSREHTSRLMKKLFDDGYVQRNTESKPYTYSITDKGKSKIGKVEVNPTVV